MKYFLRMMAVSLIAIVALLMILRRADRRWVVFHAMRPSATGSDIYLMLTDGSHFRRINPIEGCGIWPQWSPDGHWITYANYCSDTQEFLRIRPGGSTPEEITKMRDDVTRVYWSPDGQRLLLEGPAFEVRLLDTSGERLLADGYIFPGWSPDGEWVYARRYENGANVLDRIHVETGRREEVFRAENTMFALNWSPDGTRMVVTLTTERGTELFIANPDGSSLHRLMPEESAIPHILFRMSPDGEWIAFTGGGEGAGAYVYRIRPDGSDLERLTDTGRDLSFLTWSADSEWLYFVEDSFLDPKLIRLRADGSSIENVDLLEGRGYPPQVAPTAGTDWNPRWLTLAAAGLMILSVVKGRVFCERWPSCC